MSAVKISGNSREMPGKIVRPKEEVFGKGLRFGIKAVSLSSRTVGSFHETHHCSTGFILPCLPFLTNRARPTSLFLARILSFLLPLFLSLFLRSPSTSASSFLFSRSFFTLASLVLSVNLLPNGVLYGGHGRSPSACLPEKSPLRFDRRRRRRRRRHRRRHRFSRWRGWARSR